MGQSSGPTIFTPARHIYAERMLDAGPPLAEALIAVARVIEGGFGTEPLVYAGVPPEPIDLTPPAVEHWLDRVAQERRAGLLPLMTLSANPSLPAGATLGYEMEPWPVDGVGFIRCTLPVALPPVDTMLDLTTRVRLGFGAHRAEVEDDLLLMRYRGVRAAERARSVVPPHLRQYVPDPHPVDGVAGDLPDLLVPQEFDRRRVPDAIWWVNVWDAVQVETVGRERILAAPWVRIIELPDGGMTLAATEEATNPGDPQHLAQLTRLVQALDLRALQEAHRLGR